MPRYLIWREDESREDASRIKEVDPSTAAEEWAELVDRLCAEYSIARGNTERVFVALDVDGSEPEMFEVRGEMMPVYCATAISHNAKLTGSQRDDHE